MFICITFIAWSQRFIALELMTSPRERPHKRLELGTGREEAPKQLGSPQALFNLRGKQNKALIVLRHLCYEKKRQNGGLACTPFQILSATLPASILAQVFTSLLSFPLTTADPPPPQALLSVPFPFQFSSISPFSSQKTHFSEINWTHGHPRCSNCISFWGKLRKTTRGATSAQLWFNLTYQQDQQLQRVPWDCSDHLQGGSWVPD